MTTNGPRPATAILDISTGKLYEILESYMGAGFTREEAMQLVKIHLVDYLMDAEDDTE